MIDRCNYIHLRIGGGGALGMRGPISFFLMQFSEKIWPDNRLHTPPFLWGWRPRLGYPEIASGIDFDVPSMISWIRL